VGHVKREAASDSSRHRIYYQHGLFDLMRKRTYVIVDEDFPFYFSIGEHFVYF
jgi:hypothetical protein